MNNCVRKENEKKKMFKKKQLISLKKEKRKRLKKKIRIFKNKYCIYILACILCI